MVAHFFDVKERGKCNEGRRKGITLIESAANCAYCQ